MKPFKSSYLILIFLLATSFGCRPNKHNNTPDPSQASQSDSVAEYLEYANKALNEHEEKKIMQYIQRHGWDLQTTSSGLRYKVYRKGEGVNALPGNRVVVNYSLSTLNGILLASSENDGPMAVIVERTDVISGLHELLQFMNEGAKARAVIPSRLGYGFTGDQERIPKGATLVYDVEVVSIDNNN